SFLHGTIQALGAEPGRCLRRKAQPRPEFRKADRRAEAERNGKGTDYICFRADGKALLHIHAEVTTDDGKKIALFADGVAIGQQGSPVFRLRENVTLTTSEP